MISTCLSLVPLFISLQTFATLPLTDVPTGASEVRIVGTHDVGPVSLPLERTADGYSLPGEGIPDGKVSFLFEATLANGSVVNFTSRAFPSYRDNRDGNVTHYGRLAGGTLLTRESGANVFPIHRVTRNKDGCGDAQVLISINNYEPHVIKLAFDNESNGCLARVLADPPFDFFSLRDGFFGTSQPVEGVRSRAIPLNTVTGYPDRVVVAPLVTSGYFDSREPADFLATPLSNDEVALVSPDTLQEALTIPSNFLRESIGLWRQYHSPAILAHAWGHKLQEMSTAEEFEAMARAVNYFGSPKCALKIYDTGFEALSEASEQRTLYFFKARFSVVCPDSGLDSEAALSLYNQYYADGAEIDGWLEYLLLGAYLCSKNGDFVQAREIVEEIEALSDNETPVPTSETMFSPYFLAAELLTEIGRSTDNAEVTAIGFARKMRYAPTQGVKMDAQASLSRVMAKLSGNGSGR